MAHGIQHRAPDVYGVVESGISLIHRRLSIIDHSNNDDQAMHSQCGRYVIFYDAETYNYIELKRELEAEFAQINSREHFDTEVLVESIARKGIDSRLQSLSGMDKKERQLCLARDRIGLLLTCRKASCFCIRTKAT